MENALTCAAGATLLVVATYLIITTLYRHHNNTRRVDFTDKSVLDRFGYSGIYLTTVVTLLESRGLPRWIVDVIHYWHYLTRLDVKYPFLLVIKVRGSRASDPARELYINVSIRFYELQRRKHDPRSSPPVYASLLC